MTAKVLKNILKEQDQLTTDNVDTAQDSETVLCYHVRGSDYYTPLEEIKEVLEVLSITPYPTYTPGHLGVVNIRGRIIPVINIFDSSSTSNFNFTASGISELNKNKFRMILFESRCGQQFSIIAKNVKKSIVSSSLIENSDNNNSEKVLKVDGIPYRSFSPESIFKTNLEEKGQAS